MAGYVWVGLGGTRMNLVGGGVFLVLGAMGVVWPGVGVVAGGGEAEEAGGFGLSFLCHFFIDLRYTRQVGGGGLMHRCPCELRLSLGCASPCGNLTPGRHFC